MNVRCLIILLLAVLVASCRPNEPEAAQLEVESWDMPVGLSSATSVVWNDTLYVLFGRERTGSYASQSPHPKGYAVSLADPTVQREFALPVKPRVKAAGVLVGDDYYFGLGFNGKVYSDTANLTDWWRWNFKDRTLHRLADMMTKDTDAAIVWAVGRKIYVSLGFSTIFSGRSYCYDIETDKWEVISDNTIDKVRPEQWGSVLQGEVLPEAAVIPICSTTGTSSTTARRGGLPGNVCPPRAGFLPPRLPTTAAYMCLEADILAVPRQMGTSTKV